MSDFISGKFFRISALNFSSVPLLCFASSVPPIIHVLDLSPAVTVSGLSLSFFIFVVFS